VNYQTKFFKVDEMSITITKNNKTRVLRLESSKVLPVVDLVLWLGYDIKIGEQKNG